MLKEAREGTGIPGAGSGCKLLGVGAGNEQQVLSTMEPSF